MQACISLGGNIGDVAATFRSALLGLQYSPRVTLVQSSGVYRTAPVGPDAGDPFLNAAATLETDREPHDLLDLLQDIEYEHERTHEVHWGPRTLDLDLILYGEETVASPRLAVPHPDCWYRRFVLEPLAEIAADSRHPYLNQSLGQLRERLFASEFRVAIIGQNALGDDESEIVSQLSSQFPGVTLARSSVSRVRDFEVVVTFSNYDHEPLPRLPPFWLPGDPVEPEQFLRDLLLAARGEVERIGELA